jgi:hypothetical protein
MGNSLVESRNGLAEQDDSAVFRAAKKARHEAGLFVLGV